MVWPLAICLMLIIAISAVFGKMGLGWGIVEKTSWTELSVSLDDGGLR
jgi:hypothetical protein